MTQHTVSIPSELIPELEAWGKLTAKLFGRLRQQAGLVPKGVPKDQAWFWSKRWQAMEREADAALERGEYDEFDTIDEAISWFTRKYEAPFFKDLHERLHAITSGHPKEN